MAGSTDERFRVCVIGAGWLGRKHLEGWRLVPDARVVALADPSEENLRTAGRDFGVERLYRDHRAALEHEEVNVVSVCTPTRFHAEAAMAGLEAGCDVLSCKPMARTVDEARAMIRAAARAGRTLAIGHNIRFAGWLRAMREQIQAGAIGRPVMFTYRNFLEARFKLAMHERQGNGGPVLDMGIHYYDLWRQTFGSEPTRVIASGMTFGPHQPELAAVSEFAVDTATVMVEHASGDLGVMSITWALPRGIAMSGPAPDVAVGPEGLLRGDPDQGTVLFGRGGRQETIVAGPANDFFLDEIVDFAARLRDGRPPNADGYDGLRALQVALAALESIETGAPAAVPSPQTVA